MLERERQNAIMHFVRQNKYISIHEAVELSESSEATIRRDFSHLEKEGKIQRVRGGAELSSSELANDSESPIELPFEYRKSLLSNTKRKIAEKAVSMITDGETIIIDGGSTTYQMVSFLEKLELTVITNSFAIAEHMVKNSISKIVLPEGMIYPESLLILNPLESDPFRNYHATKVFMGVEGIHDNKLTNTRVELIQIERSMINHANELIILADSSKFRTSGNFFLCELAQVSTIITDDGITPEDKSRIREKGINLVIV